MISVVSWGGKLFGQSKQAGARRGRGGNSQPFCTSKLSAKGEPEAQVLF